MCSGAALFYLIAPTQASEKDLSMCSEIQRAFRKQFQLYKPCISHESTVSANP